MASTTESIVIEIEASTTVAEVVETLRADSKRVCILVYAPDGGTNEGKQVVLQGPDTRVQGQLACGEGLRPFSNALAARMPVVLELLQAPPPNGEMFGGDLLAVQLLFGPQARLNNAGGVVGGSIGPAPQWLARLADHEFPVALVTWPSDDLDAPDPVLDLVNEMLDDAPHPNYDAQILEALPSLTPQLGGCATKGTALLHFDIASDGAVDNVAALTSDLEPAVERCVRDVIDTMDLEVAPDAEHSHALLPIAIGS